MIRYFVIAVVGLVLLCLAFQDARALEISDGSIDIAYVEPKNPEFQPIYEALKRRRVLEELRLFLSPLRLPQRVLVKSDECGATGHQDRTANLVVLCYEQLSMVRGLAPLNETPRGISRDYVLIGAFVQYVLHEVAHAVFDQLKVPIWGREEDAADKLAAFIMLQFGKDVAIRTLPGAIWFFEASERTWTGSDFARETSPEAQRFYNYLCIAYGGDPETFREMVRDTLLKTRRAANCTHEYQEELFAFRRTILPFVDREQLKKIQSMEWAKPEN